MYQTGTLGFQPFSTRIPYEPGFCRWWYKAWDEIEGWPIIDPKTQKLNGPITVSTPWFGPMQVPSDELGFSEKAKRTGAGLYFDQTVSGFYPGDSADSRINIENSLRGEWVIVGKVRAGGMYLVFGSEEKGLELNQDYESKGDETAGGDFSFSGQSLYKALILPAFDETNVLPPSGYTPPPVVTPDPDDMEILTYNNEQLLQIEWTTARQQKYGSMPVIQVWYTEPGSGLKINTSPLIGIDAAPPNMSQITVQINAPGPGFITLSR